MVILLVILGISALILIHELGHFLVAKLFKVKVEEFGFGFPPRLFSFRRGETLYSFNLLPFGGFVRLLGETPDQPVPVAERARSFGAQAVGKRAQIILAGVVMNFLLGWLIISSVFMIGVPKTLLVTEVVPQSPAAELQMLAGDQILGFETAEKFIAFIQANKGKEIVLELRRAGEPQTIRVTPRLDPPAGQGALGVAVTDVGLDQQPVGQSLVEGFKTSFYIVGAIFSGLYHLLLTLVSQQTLLPGFVGPIGIFGVANQSASLGMVYLLQLIGLISLNLFALNILPFPALDGGRFLFLLLEKLKGSPLSPKFERSANAAGFLVLILLMLAVTVRDVVHLF